MGRVKCAGCGGDLVLPFKTEPDGLYWHGRKECFARTPPAPEAK